MCLLFFFLILKIGDIYNVEVNMGIWIPTKQEIGERGSYYF